MNYYIYLNGKEVATISGTEAAYEAYARACALAEIVGGVCDLVDGNTGEVLASSDSEDI